MNNRLWARYFLLDDSQIEGHSAAQHKVWREKPCGIPLYSGIRQITLMVNAAFGRGKESKKAIFFHPLNLIDTVFYKANSETGMGRLREVSSAYDISSIRFQNVKRAIAVFGRSNLSDCKEEERNHSLFAFRKIQSLPWKRWTKGCKTFISSFSPTL